MKLIFSLYAYLTIFILIATGCSHSRHARPNQYNGVNTQSITPARSMSELNNQSRNTKPHMIYSYPANMQIGNAQFVDLSNLKFKMLNYVNSIRAHGTVCGGSTRPVDWNNELALTALEHSKDMAANNFLGHMGSGTLTDPARKREGVGSNFYERIMYHGYPIKPGSLAGEIITYSKFNIVGNQDPYQHFVHAVNNLLKSSTHCRIIMNPRFKDVGIAAYKDNEKMFWTFEFGEIRY